MPLPKRRHSAMRGRKRRTHWKLPSVNLSICPQCKQPKLAHKACSVCGYYAGKPAIEIKVKTKKKKGER